MSDKPTISKQLLDAIASADIRAKVSLIVDLSVRAVGGLDSLDQEIFRCARAAEAREGDGLPTRKELEALSVRVLVGVRALALHLSRADLGEEDAAGEGEALDFDFDLDGAGSAPSVVSLDDDDIDDVLDAFAPASRRSGDERWAAVTSELMSFSYGFSTQLDDFDKRFADALDQGRIPQALRELDDAGNALIDGVFALMSTLCETYLESFDRDQMLPGHRDALGKALLVRRGIADLRRVVKDVNVRIQDSQADDEERQAGVDAVGAALAAFIEGEAWDVTRPADRLELQNFHDEIASEPFQQAAQPCEGLDKYLDSLLSVNQRDVLIRHDRELMADIAATLEGVGPIVDISPHGAMELVRQAFAKAAALYGYHDGVDELLSEWETTAGQATEPSVLVDIGECLAGICAAALR